MSSFIHVLSANVNPVPSAEARELERSYMSGDFFTVRVMLGSFAANLILDDIEGTAAPGPWTLDARLMTPHACDFAAIPGQLQNRLADDASATTSALDVRDVTGVRRGIERSSQF
jgi:hypothetical protein